MTATTPPTIPAQASDELDQLASRADRAVEAAQALEGPARAAAVELKDAIDALHKAGLTRIVRRLKEDPRGKQLLFELVEDPLVYALLATHGIVRPDLTTRARRVLEAVRPYMRSHGGDVELVEARGDTVRVRLHGACNGCSMAAVTLRDGVEEALRQSIPEIARVEVVPSDPGPALIMPESIGVSGGLADWVAGPLAADVPPGTMQRLDDGEVRILLVHVAGRLSAYRNACAHMGLPLDGGLLDPESGELTCPWHGFCYDTASGECLTAPQAQLEAFPLRVVDGRIWVRPVAR
jgi:Fe-S cluster biogenesis protein NfuA/nitrite reductase/ring-hydroxylating ferredoxin subunit